MKYKISIISYYNTIPFIYGLNINEALKKQYTIESDTPAECAKKLINGNSDIGIVPVAVLYELLNHNIITDYCIGATGDVRSVILVSNTPINKVKKIYLDTESRTSALLTKYLAKTTWLINPLFEDVQEGFDYFSLQNHEAALAIGNKCFEISHHFNFCYDLAGEWLKITQMPFVFACWVAKKTVSSDFILSFNESLKYGVNHIDEAIKNYKFPLPNDIYLYLTKNISFTFDDNKRKAIKLFLQNCNDL